MYMQNDIIFLLKEVERVVAERCERQHQAEFEIFAGSGLAHVANVHQKWSDQHDVDQVDPAQHPFHDHFIGMIEDDYRANGQHYGEESGRQLVPAKSDVEKEGADDRYVQQSDQHYTTTARKKNNTQLVLSMLRTFYISFAMPSCTSSTVFEVLDPLLDNQVSVIEEELCEDDHRPGKHFKRFWITTDETRLMGGMRKMLDEIALHGCARVHYAGTRYWQVKLDDRPRPEDPALHVRAGASC